MEMVEADNMVLGRNGRGSGGGRPKYKLQLKKLKKGFKPGMKYKRKWILLLFIPETCGFIWIRQFGTVLMQGIGIVVTHPLAI